jgi:hypothetical protein
MFYTHSKAYLSKLEVTLHIKTMLRAIYVVGKTLYQIEIVKSRVI